MSDPASQVITALRDGHNELVDFTSGLSSDDLVRPSGAAKWDISQVLSHLGSGAEITLAVLDAALADADTPGIDFNRTVWARWDAMKPTERLTGFLRVNETVVQRFEGLNDIIRAELRIDLRFLPEPVDVATAARLRLSELAYHTWDIKVAFDPAAVLVPAAVEPLIDLLDIIIGFLGHADALEGKQATLAVQTTTPDRLFGLDLSHTVTLVDEPQQVDGVLNAPGEAWLRLVAGRLTPQHTPPTVRLKSDTLILDDLRRVFSGF